jgi:hypothetical protein
MPPRAPVQRKNRRSSGCDGSRIMDESVVENWRRPEESAIANVIGLCEHSVERAGRNVKHPFHRPREGIDGYGRGC